jgi:hypothetical protein
MEFNTPKFIASVRKIHLTTTKERQVYNSIPVEQVRPMLDNFIDYEGN